MAGITAIAGIAVMAAPADGAVRKVPQQFSTIQAAVDAANPGDRIEIAKKRNFENVTVNKNGLKFVGTKKGVFVDGHDDDANSYGYHFDISANGVKIKRLILRQGYGIDCQGDRCGVDRVVFQANPSDCVQIDGEDGLVQRSKFTACNSYGVYITGNSDGTKVVNNSFRQINSTCLYLSSGDRVQIRGNRMIGCYGYGVDLSSNDRVTLKDNVMRRIESYGVSSSGDKLKIIGNTIRNSDDYCIYASGSDDIRVRGNRVANCYYGYYLSGQNPVVVNNRSDDSDDYGFDIYCSTACDDAVIEKNVATGTSDGYEGIYIGQQDSTGSMRIAANRSVGNSYDGIYLSGVDGALIVKNFAASNGGGSGIYLSGDDNVLRANVARGNSEDGFDINGDGNRLEDNVARGNHGDGFEFDNGGLGNTWLRNSAIGNFAEGFDNGGTNTVARHNVARGNRIDCASDGTFAQKKKNRCADKSNFNVDPEVSRVKR